jgi:hypothetical protein
VRLDGPRALGLELVSAVLLEKLAGLVAIHGAEAQPDR